MNLVIHCIWTLILSTGVCSAQRYMFCVREDGMYTINNPFVNGGPGNIRVYNDAYGYSPYYDSVKNRYYVFAKKNECYYLGPSDGIAQPITGITSTFSKCAIYKYPLVNSNGGDHWFTRILKPADTMQVPGYKKKEWINPKPGRLDIRGYNFSNLYSQLRLSGPGLDTTMELEPKSGFQRSLVLENVMTNESLLFQCIMGQVGIEEINLDESSYFSFEKCYTIPANMFSEKAGKDIPFWVITTDGRLMRTRSSAAGSSIAYYIIPGDKVLDADIKPGNSIDLSPASNLVIYNPLFESGLPPLKSLIGRLTNDTVLRLISCQDIYDYYSAGKASSESIKVYIHAVASQNVLLLGDAYMDKMGKDNLVPTSYFHQQKDNNRIESDYFYCYKDDIQEPTITVGRLPFRSCEELNEYITKITYALPESNSSYYIMDDIKLFNEAPLRTTIAKFNRDGLKVINDSKPGMVQYTGHAAYNKWSNQIKMTYKEFDKIVKDGIYFNLLDLSCWTGSFANTGEDCLSESMLKNAKKGPLAIISSSGYTRIKCYRDFSRLFIDKYYRRVPLAKALNEIKRTLFIEDKISIDELHAINFLGLPWL